MFTELIFVRLRFLLDFILFEFLFSNIRSLSKRVSKGGIFYDIDEGENYNLFYSERYLKDSKYDENQYVHTSLNGF